MARSLPRRPSLSSLRKQAKALLREHSDGVDDALRRVLEGHPRPGTFSGLRDAQLVLAREYGFDSWPDLKKAVEDRLAHAPDGESRSIPGSDEADTFVDLACLTYAGDDHPARIRKAERLLREHPELAGESIFAAAAAGSVGAVERWLAEDPTRARTPGGPRGWAPLLYLTYSRVPDAPPRRNAVTAARLLLEAGADPDAHVILGDAYRFTALTGAIGEGEAGMVAQPPHAKGPELAELLLEAGADPNDSQGLYNSQFTAGDEWVELLIAYGLRATDRCNWVGMGGTGTLDYLLGQAVVMGMEPRVRLLLDNGADVNGQDAYRHRTHHENALLNGHVAIARLLEERGALPAELSAADRFRAACMTGEIEQALALVEADPSLLAQPGLFVDCARHGSIGGLGRLLDLGIDVNQSTSDGRTALHQAGWDGNLELIRFLVDHGADVDVRDAQYEATPAAWANESGRYQARDALLDHSRDVHDLATWGRPEALGELLEARPSLAGLRLPKSGRTPLHRLETDGEQGARVIDLLLAHGADIDAKDAGGRTPLATARTNQRDEVAALLRARGAVEV